MSADLRLEQCPLNPEDPEVAKQPRGRNDFGSWSLVALASVTLLVTLLGAGAGSGWLLANSRAGRVQGSSVYRVEPRTAESLESYSSNLDHLKMIQLQSMVSNQPDDLFPAGESSIGPPGSNCADHSAVVFRDCQIYNHWTTFQELAQKTGKAFRVFPSGGLSWKDIAQGEIETSYFLAALASIARSDADIIHAMFVNREKWDDNIFTTRWLINGNEAHIEVDNSVPGGDSRPFFASPSSSGAWWVVILEKALAKIYSSYLAAAHGWWPDAVMAMTTDPVTKISHVDWSAEDVLEKIEDAVYKGWLIGALSKSHPMYGLSSDHHYSVFQVKSGYLGKMVQLYNPWGQPGKHHDPGMNEDLEYSVFTMTFQEYFQAFEMTFIAEHHDGYQTSIKTIQTTKSAVTTWDLRVRFYGNFTVSLSWPSTHLLNAGVMDSPQATLVVSKNERHIQADPVVKGMNSVSVDVNMGSGIYTVTTGIEFPDKDVEKEVHLEIYAPQALTIMPSSEDSLDMLMQFLGPVDDHGPCQVLSIKGRGSFVLRKDQLVNGVPIYMSASGSYIMYWVPRHQTWFTTEASQLSAVQAGEVWSFSKHAKEDLLCGCHDDPDGVAGFKDLSCGAFAGEDSSSNATCDGTEYSAQVQQFCPVTCEASFCNKPSNFASASRRMAQKTCKDCKPTNIRVNGTLADCEGLKDYCHELHFVQDTCCATCATVVKQGNISNELACTDHEDLEAFVPDGERSKSCSELQGECDRHAAVRERCCQTCKAVAKGILYE